ncbi:MAG: V-type ATP synthase subunit I [Atopobiaceae bacterium]
MGLMEFHESDIESDGLEKMDTQAARIRFDRSAETLEDALKKLSIYAPAKKGGSLFPEKEVISRSHYDEIAGDAQEYLDKASDVVALAKEIDEAKAGIIKNRATQAALRPWEKLSVPLNYRGTKAAGFIVGTFGSFEDESQILANLTRDMEDPAPVDITVLEQTSELTYVAIMYHKSVEGTLENNLREAGFARPSTNSGDSRIPTQIIEDLDKECDRLAQTIEENKAKIATFSDLRDEFRITSDYYRARSERYQLLGTVLQSKSMFFIEGWVEASKADALIAYVEDKFDALAEKEQAKEGEEPPTELRNNKFSRITESVLTSYGLPTHGRVDPTFIMTFFYVIFFGMMLSDAGYGIVMSIVCAIVLAKHKHIQSGMKSMLTLFFWCGLSTAFWGFMFGGFFGNAIDTIATTFFGYTGPTIVRPLWFDPMSSPMYLLMWCMLFGVIHLFTGLAIKGYELLHARDFVGFVSDVLDWFLFLIGLILLLIPTDIFASIVGMKFSLPPVVSTIAQWLTIAGMVIILLMGGRDKKNWALRIALGAYDLYGISSWLSDVLSYSRLLALGLATGVIASVVNMLCTMVSGIGGIFGVVLFIVVFLLGHLMNMAINLLGAYVHTNRLQFVEFFGKFYDAGGRAFAPFGTNFKYIEIREEN